MIADDKILNAAIHIYGDYSGLPIHVEGMIAAIEAVVVAERERCAKIAEQKMIEWKDFRGGKELEASFKINAARQIAAAIRAVPPQQHEGE